MRTLKPGFFTNDQLAELKFETRLLFAGLWCLADRAGRLEDRPKKIKGELFPFDNVNVDRMLASLETAGFIQRYELDGVQTIQVLNFEKHQHPNIKEPASTLPPPPWDGASTTPALVGHVPARDGTTPALHSRAHAVEQEQEPVQVQEQEPVQEQERAARAEARRSLPPAAGDAAFSSLIAEFSPALGETKVRQAISRASNYRSADRVAMVRGWLEQDVAKLPARSEPASEAASVGVGGVDWNYLAQQEDDDE